MTCKSASAPQSAQRISPRLSYIRLVFTSDLEAKNMRGVQMQSEIEVGQRFRFNMSSDDSAPERQAVVTRVLSNREEGFRTEVYFFFSYWVEAYELPETEVTTTLVFERGTDGNVYLDGRMVSITILK